MCYNCMIVSTTKLRDIEVIHYQVTLRDSVRVRPRLGRISRVGSRRWIDECADARDRTSQSIERASFGKKTGRMSKNSKSSFLLIMELLWRTQLPNEQQSRGNVMSSRVHTKLI